MSVRRRWFQVAVAVAGVLGAIHFGGRALIASAIAHAPNRRAAPPPGPSSRPAALAGLDTRDLAIDVGPPRARLAAWLVEASGAPRATVVVLHGVRSDKSAMAPIGARLARAGYRTLLVDLRGHGASSGEFLTYGVQESRDLVALADALEQRGLLAGELSVYGFSYGGAAAIHWAARDRRVRAVVAVSTFASLRAVVGDYTRRYLPVLSAGIPDAWLQDAVDEAGSLAAFDPEQASTLRALRRVAAPVLLVHGALDTQVPTEHSRELIRVADPRSRLVVVPGETHATIPADRRGVVLKETLDWLGRWLRTDGPRRTPAVRRESAQTAGAGPGRASSR